MLFVNSAGRSGLDVLRHVRSTAGLKDVPVVVLTGFTLNQAIVAEVESLRGELWTKPMSPRALVERLTALVSDSPPR
jgi:DNA-binding response OmpR family regulator